MEYCTTLTSVASVILTSKECSMFDICREESMSEWLLCNSKSVICQPYHGKKKLLLDEMMISVHRQTCCSTLTHYTVSRTTSLCRINISFQINMLHCLYFESWPWWSVLDKTWCLLVTCGRSMISSKYSSFLHQ